MSPDVHTCDWNNQFAIDPALKAGIRRAMQKKIKLEGKCENENKVVAGIVTEGKCENKIIPKTVTESSSEKTCSDCVKFNNCVGRNEHFSRLLHEELQFIQPCMRTRVYAKILQFVDTIRNCHSSEMDLTDSEKNN